LRTVDTDNIKKNVAVIGQQLRDENGLERAVGEIERYFET